MVVILIQTTNLLWFFRALQLSTDIAVLRTVASLNAQPAIGPQLSLAVAQKAIRYLFAQPRV